MRLYYGVWDGVVHDNRGTADYKEPEGLDLKNLLQFNNGNPVMTFISHRGFLVFHPHANLLFAMNKYYSTVKDNSCGKCTPCRVGTKRLLEILNKITSGNGTLEDIDKMEELCYYIKENSLCGLGQTAPNPVLSTLKYYRDEYEAHVVEHRCPAGACKALTNYSIVADKCKGCTLCARNCPVGAISGSVKQPHVIDTTKCIKCGVCMEKCKFGAVVRK